MLHIKTEKFTGPLGLLLQLIEKEELDITEVSLAKIADQYVELIRKSSRIDPDHTADFLVVAAKLLYIKSKALLPYLVLDEEEEQDLEEFERQLRMYKEFIEATKEIEKKLGKKKFMFAREFSRKAIFNSAKIFSPPKKLNSEELRMVFTDILNKAKPVKKELEQETLEHKINIEDKIMRIQSLLLDRIKFSFNKLRQESNSKTEVIVSFLAMLELSKQRELILEQSELFGDITINRF